MPNTTSAKKRLRQTVKRTLNNRAVKSNVRNEVRKVRKLIEAGDLLACEAELRIASRKLDQAAGKRVIHPNAAARTKSRLSAAIKGLKDKKAAAPAG